jgi:hypothetical protein
MTPVGHCLMGATIAVATIPQHWSRSRKALAAIALIILANAPDLHLPCWGHERYDVSHSLFVAVVFWLLVAVIVYAYPMMKTREGRFYFVATGAAAWGSHLLLDTFYNHGQGLAVFWPFSDARIAIPIPWLAVLESSPPPLNGRTFGIWAVEGAFFGAIFLFLLFLRMRFFALFAKEDAKLR